MSTILKKKIAITILAATLAIPTSWGWGFRGHVLASAMAYDELSTKNKTIVDRYTNIILAQLSHHFRDQLQKRYPEGSSFVILSVLPDTWHDQTLAEIFHRFNAPLPSALQPYKNDLTRAWHFIDNPYPKQSHCHLKPAAVNAVSIMPILEQAWQQTHNDNSRALLLIFITHITTDLHQPLHTLSHTDTQCHIDAGGNNTPIRWNGKKSNLHQLWDNALGYLNPATDYTTEVRLLKKIPSVESPADLNPNDWTIENRKYAPFIYSTPLYQEPSESYIQTGQVLAFQQINLAGHRLAKKLELFLKAPNID